MLSPPDADLVRRDPALPGLATLFDEDAIADLLSAAIPGLHGASVRSIYVRYKPGTRCLVAYETCVDGTVQHCHANAYTRTRWAERTAANRDRPYVRGAGWCVTADPLAVVITAFPDDDRLRALPRLWDATTRGDMMRKLVPHCEALHTPRVETLAYKPGRRYVATLSGDGVQAVIKLYDQELSESVRAAVRRLRTRGPLRIARRIGRSRRYRALLFEWTPGDRLDDLISSGGAAAEPMGRVGAALAELHHQLRHVDVRRAAREDESTGAAARAIGVLCPSLSGRAKTCAEAWVERLRTMPLAAQPVHGDFYPAQVLVEGDAVGVLDLDRVTWSDVALDLGTFAAHLEYATLTGSLSASARDEAVSSLVDGYERAIGAPIGDRVRVHRAAALLRHGGPRPFRTRAPRWDQLTAAVLERAEDLLREHRRPPREPRDADAGLPSIALDASVAARHLAPLFSRPGGEVSIRAIRVVRHKPGRRSLIEYDLAVADGERVTDRFTAIGKVKARGADERTHRLSQALWNTGFASDAADGISIPEPLGVVPALSMWLQRKAPGTPAAALLDTCGPPFGRRVAEVIHKLHAASHPAARHHGVDDELQILEERLILVGRERPAWRPRLEALSTVCRHRLDALPAPKRSGIHRDFHPGQLLFDGGRVYLLDLDLYASGDPALDVGNFLAHLAEYSLRAFDNPNRLRQCEAALVRRYRELAPGVAPESIEAYRMVSLARHVYISGVMADRRPFAERILEYCESQAAVD